MCALCDTAKVDHCFYFSSVCTYLARKMLVYKPFSMRLLYGNVLPRGLLLNGARIFYKHRAQILSLCRVKPSHPAVTNSPVPQKNHFRRWNSSPSHIKCNILFHPSDGKSKKKDGRDWPGAGVVSLDLIAGWRRHYARVWQDKLFVSTSISPLDWFLRLHNWQHK